MLMPKPWALNLCPPTTQVINDTISRAKEEVKLLINKFQSAQLEPQPGCSMMESFENQVNQVLNKARDDAGKTAQKTLKEDNNVKRMVTAGSKGSFINISQMIACVGQQNVEGKRIPYGAAPDPAPLLAPQGTLAGTCALTLLPPGIHRFPEAVLAPFHGRRLRPRVPRLCGELVPSRADAAGVLLPRHGRSGGPHRHGCQG